MAEDKHNYLEKYNDVNVPTGIHIGFKVYIFNLIDLGVCIAAFMLANKITVLIPMQPLFMVGTYIFVIGIAIFAIVKMPYNPIERNFKVVYYALMYHRHRYWPVDVQTIKRKENTTNEDWQ